MTDPVFSDHILASLDCAPLPPQHDTDMTDVATKTTTPETIVPHGEPRYEIEENSSAAQVYLVTEMSLDRMEEIEHDVEAL
ncbi:hypothetical protein Tco_0164343 [Tanacetum coccineum]